MRVSRIASTLSFLGATALALPSRAAAQTQAWGGVCIANVRGEVGSGDIATIQGLQCLIANIFAVAVAGIGLAGFAMIIFGAFRYQLSGGNTKAPEDARNTVTFAIVGIVVALSSFIILNVLAAFTGVDVIKNFRLSVP